jgi:hypothetical protein
MAGQDELSPVRSAPHQVEPQADPDAETRELAAILDEGGGSKEAEEAFYDASRVRPELRPSFVEMQKAYTQKTQALAEVRKGLEAQKGQLEDAQRQAAILQGLLSDNRVRTFLNRLRAQEQGLPSGEGTLTEEGTEDDSQVDPVVHQAVEKRIAPLRDELTQLRARLEVSQERESFVRAHPDYGKYKELMAEAIREDPRRSLWDAYNWAYRKRTESALADARKRLTARRQSPEGAGTAAEVRKVSRVTNFKEAVDGALDELELSRDDLRL